MLPRKRVNTLVKGEDVNFFSGNLPGWQTRSDPTFNLADELRLHLGESKYIYRNYTAYSNESLQPNHRMMVSFRIRHSYNNVEVASQSKGSFIKKWDEFLCPTDILKCHLYEDCYLRKRTNILSDHLIENIDPVGDSLHKISDDLEGNSVLVSVGGRMLEQLLVFSKDRLLCSHCTGGKIQQIAPLEVKDNATNNWMSFIRQNSEVLLIDSTFPYMEGIETSIEDPFEVKEKIIFDNRIVNVAPSPHAKDMAVFIDRKSQLYTWNGDSNVVPHCKIEDFYAAIPSITRHQRLFTSSCDFSSHPMQLWVTSNHFVYSVDLRVPSRTIHALDTVLRPFPYYRQGIKYHQPPVYAALQSRSCSYSLYVSSERSLLQMDSRFWRDPVLRWNLHTVTEVFNRLRWHDGKATKNILPDGVMAYGNKSNNFFFTCVENAGPSGLGWHMNSALSHKCHSNSATQRPRTFSFPVPVLPDVSTDWKASGVVPQQVPHRGALILPASRDCNTNIVHLIQTNYMGDLHTSSIKVLNGEKNKTRSFCDAVGDVEVKDGSENISQGSERNDDTNKSLWAASLQSHDTALTDSLRRKTNTSLRYSTSFDKLRDEAPPNSFICVDDEISLKYHKYLPKKDILQLIATSPAAQGSTHAQPTNDVERSIQDETQYNTIRKFLRKPQSEWSLRRWSQGKWKLESETVIQAVSSWEAVRLFDVNVIGLPPLGNIARYSPSNNTSIGKHVCKVFCSSKECGTALPSFKKPSDSEKNFRDITNDDLEELLEKWNDE